VRQVNGGLVNEIRAWNIVNVSVCAVEQLNWPSTLEFISGPRAKVKSSSFPSKGASKLKY